LPFHFFFQLSSIFARTAESPRISSKGMSFHLQLTEGIVGGFKPPTIRRVVEITGDRDTVFVKRSSLKGRDDYEVQQGVITSQEVTAFMTKLPANLGALPTENPQGGEDIYGLDTSISFQTEGFEWRNGGPEGCTGQESIVKPSAEQKALFKDLASKILEIGEHYATRSG